MAIKKIAPLFKKEDRIFSFDQPVTIALLSFLIVVLLARFISYLVVHAEALPAYLFVSIRGYRLHHFVYGNAILAILGFVKFILEAKISKRTTALLYGAGLGFVIDEFSLWSGSLTYLLPNNVYILNSVNIGAVFTVTLILLLVIYKKHKRRLKKMNDPVKIG
ncbi:MAG: hypothetical protein Q8L21_01460 [Candidatus Komeilibacteria bacterium]|nr:hypothetical protein [Candidatus Komeilibacteria bacterium]